MIQEFEYSLFENRGFVTFYIYSFFIGISTDHLLWMSDDMIRTPPQTTALDLGPAIPPPPPVRAQGYAFNGGFSSSFDQFDVHATGSNRRLNLIAVLGKLKHVGFKTN